MNTLKQNLYTTSRSSVRFSRVGSGDHTQKMKFSIKDFFSKCDQIRSFLRIWSHLLKKFLMENLIFCAVDGGLRSLGKDENWL